MDLKGKVAVCPVFHSETVSTSFSSAKLNLAPSRPHYPTGDVIFMTDSGPKRGRIINPTAAAVAEEASKTSKKFVCLSCPFHVEFPNEEVYNRHMDIAHANNSSLSTVSPVRPGSGRGSAQKSAQKSSPSSQNNCRVCSSCFENAENLHIHQVLSGHSQLYYKFCPNCPFACRAESEMAQHIETAHPNVGKSPSSLPSSPTILLFRCIVENCTASFSEGHKLSEHVDKYHFKRAFVCPKCFMMFRYSDGLKLHQKASCKGFPPTQLQLDLFETGRKSRNGASSPQRRATVEFLEDGTVKRGRGRPRKSTSEATTGVTLSPKIKTPKPPKSIPVNEQELAKKRRGRPRKKPTVGASNDPSTSASKTDRPDLLAEHDPSHWEKVRTEKGSRYLCKICNKLIEGKTQTSDHLDFHAGIKSYKCSVCGKDFSYKRKMTRHRLRHGSALNATDFPEQLAEAINKNQSQSKSGVKCRKCNRSFASYFSFWFHSQSHKRNAQAAETAATAASNIEVKQSAAKGKPKRSLKCRYCEKQFVSSAAIRDHENEHLGIQAYQCQYCAEKFTHQIVYNVHVKNAHKVEFEQQKQQQQQLSTDPPLAVVEEVVVESAECPKTDDLEQDVSLGWEQIKTNQGYRFACKSCNKTFADEISLREHVGTHSTDSSYKCQICGKKFARKQRLLAHGRVHNTSEKKKSPKTKQVFICSQCGQQFARIETLRDHENVHTGARPYTCEFCSATFANKTVYNQHLKTNHADQLPFKCSFCSQKSFKDESGLKRHQMQQHQAEIAAIQASMKPAATSSSPTLNFLCEMCGSRFADAHQLTTHKHWAHRTANQPPPTTTTTDGAQFSCEFCPRKFNGLAALSTHRARVHSAEDYSKIGPLPTDIMADETD